MYNYELEYVIGNHKKLEVPNCIKKVSIGALGECIGLETLILPETIEEISRGVLGMYGDPFPKLKKVRISKKTKLTNDWIHINEDVLDWYR